MKLPKIILVVTIAFAISGAFFAFNVAADSHNQTTVYYFTLSSTAFFNDDSPEENKDHEAQQQDSKDEPLIFLDNKYALGNVNNVEHPKLVIPALRNYKSLRLQPWENPNNWVRVFVLPNCDGANVQLCLLTIINPIYLNAAGKPKVDQHPLNTHIWAALNIGADAEWVGDYKIDLKP